MSAEYERLRAFYDTVPLPQGDAVDYMLAIFGLIPIDDLERAVAEYEDRQNSIGKRNLAQEARNALARLDASRPIGPQPRMIEVTDQ